MRVYVHSVTHQLLLFQYPLKFCVVETPYSGSYCCLYLLTQRSIKWELLQFHCVFVLWPISRACCTSIPQYWQTSIWPAVFVFSDIWRSSSLWIAHWKSIWFKNLKQLDKQPRTQYYTVLHFTYICTRISTCTKHRHMHVSATLKYMESIATYVMVYSYDQNVNVPGFQILRYTTTHGNLCG